MQVDFYILGESGAEARERFACRLAEKAFRGGFTVAIQVPDGPATARVDDLLWSFRQGSFVPHAPADQADDADPVVVGTEEGLAGRQLLINLTDALPARWRDYERVAEIVTADDPVRRPARERYRQYREAGIAPSNHQV